MIKRLLSFFKFPNAWDVKRQREEMYLSKSLDLVDLERRQRELVFKENSARYM